MSPRTTVIVFLSASLMSIPLLILLAAEPPKASTEALRERKGKFISDYRRLLIEEQLIPFQKQDTLQAISNIDTELKAREDAAKPKSDAEKKAPAEEKKSADPEKKLDAK